MNAFTKSALVLSLVAVVSPAYADYKFDDLYGPSGVSYQWMVLNKANDTFGESHTEAIDVSGDVLTTGDAVLDVLSGRSESELFDHELNALFIVAADGRADFTMNFRSLTLNNNFDVATPNLALSTPWDPETTQNELYTDYKTALGQPEGAQYDGLWRSYRFNLFRTNQTQYDSVAQYFYFQQNPTTTPSQGIPRPMVIANVGGGPADTANRSLKLRAILRDSSSSSANIVAYDQFTWIMTGPKTAGASQWVFVPVDDLNIDNSQINYHLTTEVINRSAIRYAAYNGNTNRVMDPSAWRFNLLRLHGSPYIARSFQLAPDSHIAPGLVTVYRRNYNVNETDKIPLRLYPIDDTSGVGVYALTMNHNILYGKRLGDTYRLAASEGGFNQLEITAFQPRTHTGTAFYDAVASITGSTKTVATPSTNIFTGSSIKRTQTAGMPSSAVQYFTIDQLIPGNLRTSTTEGILPVHITFNIPLTLIGSEKWNAMLRELSRHENDANISDVFADYYHLYLQAESGDNGVANVWNLTQEEGCIFSYCRL